MEGSDNNASEDSVDEPDADTLSEEVPMPAWFCSASTQLWLVVNFTDIHAIVAAEGLIDRLAECFVLVSETCNHTWSLPAIGSGMMTSSLIEIGSPICTTDEGMFISRAIKGMSRRSDMRS